MSKKEKNIEMQRFSTFFGTSEICPYDYTLSNSFSTS